MFASRSAIANVLKAVPMAMCFSGSSTWIQDSRSKVQDSESWILNLGSWILDTAIVCKLLQMFVLDVHWLLEFIFRFLSALCRYVPIKYMADFGGTIYIIWSKSQKCQNMSKPQRVLVKSYCEINNLSLGICYSPPWLPLAATLTACKTKPSREEKGRGRARLEF